MTPFDVQMSYIPWVVGARIKLMRHVDFGTEDQIRGKGPENGGGSGWRLGRRRRVRDYSSVDDSFQNVPDFGTAVSSISVSPLTKFSLELFCFSWDNNTSNLHN